MIPASRYVKILPGVLNTGGNSLVMNALYLTQNPLMPTGTVLNFASTKAVASFFGAGSAEALAAPTHFAGFATSTIKPGGMLFSAYNAAARAAFLQGGSLAGMTLAQLQALAGEITITVAGVAETSAEISLAGVASFTAAAALIQAAFTTPGFTVSYSALASAFVFTTTATGTAATLSFATATAGAIATSLALTSQGGGFLSQGAVADTPASAMTNAVAQTQNFASVVPMFEPSLSDKQNFAIWFNAQNFQYLGILWDSDPNASVLGNETCFGYLATQAGWNGVAAISGDPALALATGTTVAALALNAAVFLAGAIASINFNAAGGRTDIAFMSSPLVAATCINDTILSNLLANGYNSVVTTSTANQKFTFISPGSMFGVWDWIDSYVNQIYFNSQMQLSLMTLETSVGSIPYNAPGYGLMRATLMGPISNAISFGTIRTGVTLSANEIAEINNAAGVNAASLVSTQGFYLQILDPGPTVRAERGSPLVNLWYADGQSVQQITMGSTDVQ